MARSRSASGETAEEIGARMVATADRERRRIAQDLHDGLQIRLVLLAVKADCTCAAVARMPAVRDDVAELHAGLHEAIAELRAFVHGVMPPALTERGLYAAVEDLIDRLPTRGVLHLDDRAERLSPAVESTGYFVVSEALSNAVKHAGAEELVVSLSRADDGLRIEVRDDGVGGARIDSAGGMRGMSDRVAALAGRLLVHSPPGGGTRVIAHVPLAP